MSDETRVPTEQEMIEGTQKLYRYLSKRAARAQEKLLEFAREPLTLTRQKEYEKLKRKADSAAKDLRAFVFIIQLNGELGKRIILLRNKVDQMQTTAALTNTALDVKNKTDLN